MTTLANLLADEAWDTRPCAAPINTPRDIQNHADQWFPGDMYYPAAKNQCDGCTIKTACLQYALDNDEEHGIFGGTTPKERAAIKRRQEVA